MKDKCLCYVPSIMYESRKNRFKFLFTQLTEDWGETLFSALSKAGGKAFSNMAVGYNNVDVEAANKYGIAVGNTPVKTTDCSFLVGLYN